mgnify:CR=1 FL=1
MIRPLIFYLHENMRGAPTFLTFTFFEQPVIDVMSLLFCYFVSFFCVVNETNASELASETQDIG